MEEAQHNPARISRRGVLAGTAGITVGATAGLATPAAGAPPTSDTATGRSPSSVTPMAVSVSFAEWGSIFMAPGETQTWWFTWIFDGHRWSRMSAVPLAESPGGSSVQILQEWATNGTLQVTWRNNGSTGVLFRPTAIVAPA